MIVLVCGFGNQSSMCHQMFFYMLCYIYSIVAITYSKIWFGNFYLYDINLFWDVPSYSKWPFCSERASKNLYLQNVMVVFGLHNSFWCNKSNDLILCHWNAYLVHVLIMIWVIIIFENTFISHAKICKMLCSQSSQSSQCSQHSQYWHPKLWVISILVSQSLQSLNIVFLLRFAERNDK